MRRIRALARRLSRIYQRTTDDVRKAGAAWYRQARLKAYHMAQATGHTLRTAAGVIAALSPRLSWTANVRAAHMVLGGLTPSGVFKASLAKAIAIREGMKPLSVLGGPKVRAFYRALIGHDSAAVVDVWVARAAGVGTQLTPKAYAEVASALKLAAREAKVPTAHLQAAVWVEVRGRA